MDNNGDGVFNDRPSISPQSRARASTKRRSACSIPRASMDRWVRNAGTMPTLIHLDTNLSRTFELHSHGLAADRHQSVTLNARSANLLNHTNVTTRGQRGRLAHVYPATRRGSCSACGVRYSLHLLNGNYVKETSCPKLVTASFLLLCSAVSVCSRRPRRVTHSAADRSGTNHLPSLAGAVRPVDWLRAALHDDRTLCRPGRRRDASL